MAIMSSQNAFGYDRDSQVVLRAIDATARTASGSDTAISLKTLTAAYWDNDEIPDQAFKVVIDVDSADNTTGNETYEIFVEVDTAVGMATAVTVGHLILSAATAVGQYEILLDGDTISDLEPAATHIRTRAVLGGTTPIFHFHAWLANPVH